MTNRNCHESTENSQKPTVVQPSVAIKVSQHIGWPNQEEQQRGDTGKHPTLRAVVTNLGLQNDKQQPAEDAAALLQPRSRRNLYRSTPAALDTRQHQTAAVAAAQPQSPEAPRSDISAVRKTVDAAIANSVELLMMSPGELGMSNMLPGRHIEGIKEANSFTHVCETATENTSLASVSTYGCLGVNAPQSQQADVHYSNADPATSPACLTGVSESYAKEMRVRVVSSYMQHMIGPSICWVTCSDSVSLIV